MLEWAGKVNQQNHFLLTSLKYDVLYFAKFESVMIKQLLNWRPLPSLPKSSSFHHTYSIVSVHQKVKTQRGIIGRHRLRTYGGHDMYDDIYPTHVRHGIDIDVGNMSVICPPPSMSAKHYSLGFHLRSFDDFVWWPFITHLILQGNKNLITHAHTDTHTHTNTHTHTALELQRLV